MTKPRRESEKPVPEPPPDNLDPSNKDVFSGAEQVRRFSAQLAVGMGEDVNDEDIASVLGARAVKAFRYSLESLRGFVRRTTGEPAFCHSADIALRAVDLLYPDSVIEVALLHDTVEDRSKTLADCARRLAELEQLFGAQSARDVRHSTNSYSMILRGLEGKVPHNLPFEPSSKEVLREAIVAQQRELSPELQEMFAHEYSKLVDYFLPGVELAGGARKARVDRKYTVISELRLQSYRLFVEDIHDDARADDGFHDDTLVVKTLDLVDNLRTSEVANFGSLERILVKVETFLDCTFFLHDYVRAHPRAVTTFIELYDYLKYSLVEQLMERKRALVFLADTRFAFLADYLMREVSRLQDKYKVVRPPVPELARLRDVIRARNRALANLLA